VVEGSTWTVISLDNGNSESFTVTYKDNTATLTEIITARLFGVTRITTVTVSSNTLTWTTDGDGRYLFILTKEK